MDIKEELQQKYNCLFDNIKLIRDMIGQVYFVDRNNQRYILKLFRKNFFNQAIQSVDIMHYLYQNGFPVAKITDTFDGNKYFISENENRVGVLYKYIDGIEPNKGDLIVEIGEMTGKMRFIMSQYKNILFRHDNEFFINRYIKILDQMNYKDRGAFQQHGRDLWRRVNNLPLGFCHGDLHVGNMLIDDRQIINLFDFDAAAMAYPTYDIATVCDMTDYFSLNDRNFEIGFDETNRMLERFLNGYNRFYSLSDREIKSVFDFIAIRHFDIQATIIESQGLDCVDENFINRQYDWLMKWDKFCKNKL
ncbi:phosphotransferase [Sedimentibacter sp. zth1]|uniref:phosphotransferase enzyme family protein n=1 Tax=Sedimentibacter sp. zth1 TaxID=2816908 RepID=UPI001A90FC53|nr:phosphotransferase [Sedimentibacter sp. zth1]QSX05117.1 phosphotransferase [Sedimentibacter sp. zth1]